MNTLPSSLLILAVSLAAMGARAQFPNFPAADRVLGATNFTTAGSSSASSSSLPSPAGVAIDPLSGKLFVAASEQNAVLRFPDAATLVNGAEAEVVFGQVDFFGTNAGATATTFNQPNGLYVDGSGRLWVADRLNHRVLMFEGASTLDFGPTPDRVFGQPDFTTVTMGSSEEKMENPIAVHVDGADNLWVADSGNNRVLKFANVSSLASGAEATMVLGGMNIPAGLAVDGADRLWVADHSNNRVLRFDEAASLVGGSAANGVLGQPNFTSSGSGTSAQMVWMPSSPVLDASGTLYLADYFNNRVLIFRNAAGKADGAAADGVIGQPDFTTSTPGVTGRKMTLPYGALALDGTGRLWVADYGNHRVLRFSPDTSAATPTVLGRVPRRTTRATLVVMGTAADSSGIAQVRYRIGPGAFRTVAGTTVWKFTARLKRGANRIEIVAVDTLDNISPARLLRVTRR